MGISVSLYFRSELTVQPIQHQHLVVDMAVCDLVNRRTPLS